MKKIIITTIAFLGAACSQSAAEETKTPSATTPAQASATRAPAGDIPAPADVAAAPADAVKTASGLASKVLKKGTGTEKPGATDMVTVHYTGWTTDGKMFDSSVQRGSPAQFPLNGVIKGWTEGVALMVVGEKRRFWIPGNLAYGDTPKRPGAPAGTLVFDVELIGIKKGPSKAELDAQYTAFKAALVKGTEAICACKDIVCAQAAMTEMTKTEPPRMRPSPEQIAEITPFMQRLQGCQQKLAATMAPKAPAAPASQPAK